MTSDAKRVTEDVVKKLYPKRPEEVKKYDNGLLLVIGGSEMYSGAPALVSLAAFRTGVDMVRVFAPERAANIIASFTPILASYPLASSHLNPEHVATLLEVTQGAQEVSHGKVAVAIGGGLGRTPGVLEAVYQYLSQISVPVVIDADALYAVSKNPDVVKGKPFLLTPNTHEFKVVTGKEVRAEQAEDRIDIVKEEAKRLETTILLKVKTDIITDGEQVMLNETGSPYLSIGGAGETLTGIAGALLARSASPLEAGAAAAYINGKAGELAANTYKESLVATDLIDAIKDILPLS